MMLRVEQGKGRKDRFAMLSPQLLELLRGWWRIARPPIWLFPGRDLISPMTTRQLNRVCHMAAELASLPKWVAPHRVDRDCLCVTRIVTRRCSRRDFYDL